MITIKKNDVLLRDQKQWLHFSDPQTIIVAKTLHEVIPALTRVERLIEEKNWHAAGLLNYESAAAFDPALHSKPLTGFPYLWFGLYLQPTTIGLPRSEQPKPILDWQPTMDRDTYNEAIAKIKEYISQGKTYQVNYTMQLRANFDASAWDFFLHLVEAQHNHAAYIDLGRYVICSASPELFFELNGDTITCHPMKGTVKRGHTTSEDQQQSEWLKNSDKNRAENVMIVDMIRNDLGRIAKTGSIHVPELFCAERYPSLWQMTSTITAETAASLTNIFRALFPCASITGAPKVSTMQIIDELEDTPRRIYTGSIGYISPLRKAKFNVAIRTLLIDLETQKAEYGVGGGIVWDSDSAEEYYEALLKARVLTEPQAEFSLFETMLWTPAEGFCLREKHINRLLDSADYFDFATSRRAVEETLDTTASGFETAQRVRLLVDKEGRIKIESTAFQPNTRTISARLAKREINSNNVFLFHKTTHRVVYKEAQADFPDCDDVLLYNERGEPTEFTMGNIVLGLDGQMITPPIECGLLAGTFRAHLVEIGQVIERRISIARLRDCTEIFRVNSVRKWEKVEMRE